MKNIALIYFTKYGQTSKIAAYLEQKFVGWGHGVQLIDAGKGNFKLREDVDTVVVGAPVFTGKFPRKLLRKIREHRAELEGKRLALFTVSLNAADERPGSRVADRALLRQWIDEAGLVPTHVASFAGALKYPSYSWPIRHVMKRISAEAGGGVDTALEYEYTDWHRVGAFATAVEHDLSDPHFSCVEIFPEHRNMDRWMPRFEQVWRTHIDVDASPTDVDAAIRNVHPLEKFGNTPLEDEPGRELVASLVGKFWQLNFGIRRLTREEFARFREPGYAMVVSNFRFEGHGVNRTRVHSEMRIHCTDAKSAARFAIYWTILGPGIHLFMRSALRALKRQAEAHISHSTAVPTGR